MHYIGGIDIGGTKCAVSLAAVDGGTVTILAKKQIPTQQLPEDKAQGLGDLLAELLEECPEVKPEAIGISCGSPLDSARGIILSPPNLPDWVRVDVVSPLQSRFGMPVALQNDANACALAEWLWGAGRGARNMIFLTFGTGLGAGLILNGQLYSGTNDMAGEVGHVRLASKGPVGYGKAGSFEGFCSGGGIQSLAHSYVEDWKKKGQSSRLFACRDIQKGPSAAEVGGAAQEGDALALEIMHEVGFRLGQGLSMLIDVLNPEKIVIGSIFARQEALLRPGMEAIIGQEALADSAKCCQILPAQLGELLGDYAACSVGMNLLLQNS